MSEGEIPMIVRWFRYPYWELNFIGVHWQLRIGSRQIALWHDYIPKFNFARAFPNA